MELKDIAAKAGVTIHDLVNLRSRNLKELGLGSISGLTEAEVIDLIVANPKILHRPIVIKDGQVLLGFTEARFTDFFLQK